MTTVKRRIRFCACREMFYAWIKNDEIFQHESFSLFSSFFWNVHNVMHTKKKFTKKKGKGIEIEIRNL